MGHVPTIPHFDVALGPEPGHLDGLPPPNYSDVGFRAFAVRIGGKIMIEERVNRLRKLLADYGLQAYIVPSTDDHQNEYVPECWRRREWISGFTGSAGTAVITAEQAGLWTDGRYHLQALEELDQKVYVLFPLGLPETPEIKDWLAETLDAGQSVGIDPKLISVHDARELRETLKTRGITLRFPDQNLIDLLWDDRPPLPSAPLRAYPERFAGETAVAKLSRVGEEMSKVQAAAHILSSLDAIAWLLNLRGADIRYNPVFTAYLLITPDELLLFVDPTKITPESAALLDGLASVRPYGAFRDAVAGCAARHKKILVDPQRTSQWVYQEIVKAGGEPVTKPSPLIRLKAVKNPVERNGMRRCHLRDGLAVVRFLRWLEDRVPLGGVTELTAVRKLLEFREEMELFQGLSFATIVGYGPHGAVIHYAPSAESDVELAPRGLLLFDSGGHYMDGTTDVTRTVTLGYPTEEERACFTRVLKGHIRLARTRFPKGTTGKQLDALARLHLWDVGLDYRHGTGHGVGVFLNVHEGPQSLSPKDPGVPLEPGMILTNEPGYYKPDAFGIRLESVMLLEEDTKVHTDYGPFYRFEILTQVPIDQRLVIRAMLSTEERSWVDAYHARVLQQLSPLLSEAERRWLQEATRPL
jgi:Xaa-Pro aminopeptidase